MSKVSKVNLWLLTSTLFAYFCYAVPLFANGAITTGTAIGVAASTLFMNGYGLALAIFTAIFILLFLLDKASAKFRRWSDGILDKIAEKTADKINKKKDD